MNFPILFTARLNLRQLADRDENEIFILRSDPRVSEYLDRALYESHDQARDFIARIERDRSAGDCEYWAISLKGQEKLIGAICLWNFEKEEHKAEIGYELMAEHQGQGYLREALAAIVEYGFDVLKLREIKAFPNPRNARSVNLLVKSGFTENKALSTETAAYYSLSPQLPGSCS